MKLYRVTPPWIGKEYLVRAESAPKAKKAVCEYFRKAWNHRHKARQFSAELVRFDDCGVCPV